MPDIKAEIDIPDVWFDFFARLLPGLAFVLAVRVFHQGNETVPTGAELILLVAAGYFVGLFTSPAASRVSRWIECSAASRKRSDVHYVSCAQIALGRTSVDSMTLSKMHGEVVFFTQCLLLAILYWAVELLVDPTGQVLGIYAVLLGAVAGVLAMEVASRRVDKAADFMTVAESQGKPHPG